MCGHELALAVLEEFHVPQTLLGFCLTLVWSAQVLPLLRHHFVAAFHLFDHIRVLVSIFSEAATKSMDESL
jgi:hypothetical protein